MKKNRNNAKIGTEKTAAQNLSNSKTIKQESGASQRDFYEEFRTKFIGLSNKDLIQAFNREVGNPGWTSARAAYLTALHQEFEDRGLDYSLIGNKTKLSFAKRVKLVGNKIVPTE